MARRHGIPISSRCYGEEGTETQRYKVGRPSITLTLPTTRCLHTDVGILSRKDFDRAVGRLRELSSHGTQQLDQAVDIRLAFGFGEGEQETILQKGIVPFQR